MTADDVYSPVATPMDIRYLKADRMLEIDWDNGMKSRFPAEFLRVESPSAEVRGHHPDQKIIVSKRRHVGIMGIEPVGNYAIRIQFDDLHDTGIYSWQLLMDYHHRQDQIWAEYLAALDKQGLSRDP